jgi:glutamate-5-semialdehyde dehydrogenase
MTPMASQADLSYAVYQVGQAANDLKAAGAVTQSELLEAMAAYLEAQQDQVLEANTLDLEASLEMAVPDLVLDWLKLTPERLQTALKILRRLASLGDPRGLSQQPIGRLTKAISGYSQVVPLGVIALVYEAFPELSAIMAGLCVRTGNGLILKGGNEASQTNQAILQALHNALDDVGLPQLCILSLTAEQGDAARSWLLQDEGVDLVIPYGRPSLVQQVTRQASVPVLPTAMGNCYLYWSASGQLDTVTQMIVDSHRGEPDAVNAIEKVLIHEGCSNSAVVKLCHNLWEQNFDIIGDGALLTDIPELKSAKQVDWEKPFLSKTVALRKVDSISTATRLMNRYGSRHASCLATESYQENGQFTRLMESAVIYTNASPRFSRNPSQASAIALGMTGQRGCCSGFIGLDALLTTQHVLQGGI